jgi:hypothetical protein
MGMFDSMKDMMNMAKAAPGMAQAAQAQAAQHQQGLDPNVDMSGPQWEAIEGVTLDQYAEIAGKMAKQGVMGPEAVGTFAEQHGVPAGKWQAVQNGWTQRMGQHVDVRNRFGMLYSQFSM